MKANYQLGHGDIGIDSKYNYQLLFDQQYFPATLLVPHTLRINQKKKLIHSFVETHKFPLILKPDL
jgi:glutathione synthase/RimK-type ligase-like ATP-grasp enzyme